MVRKTTRVTVAKAKYNSYKIVADNFYNGAINSYEFDYYNAAGLLIVHCAIAYSDAISIKLKGIKSQGEDHEQAILLLDEVVASSDEKKIALNQLRKLIAHKNSVSYSGDIYQKKDVDEMMKLIERFRNWAEKIL